MRKQEAQRKTKVIFNVYIIKSCCGHIYSKIFDVSRVEKHHIKYVLVLNTCKIVLAAIESTECFTNVYS